MNSTAKRRLALALTCVLAACQAHDARAQFGAAAPASGPPDSTLRFMVLGDWGNGSQQQKDVAEAMARYADAHRVAEPGPTFNRAGEVEFVVLTGDNFYESGVSGVDDPQWQDRFEKIYDPVRLPMPFLAVLGNHDWVLNPVAQIQYAHSRPSIMGVVDHGGDKPDPHARATPFTRWQMDGFWYARTFGRVGEGEKATPLADFFFIDTDLWTLKLGALADKQMAWLESGLKNSKAKWQLVVAHHPLYSDGEHGHEGDISMLRDKLSPVFQKWGADAYLCGHDHDLQHIEIAGHPTSFVVSGAGGKLRTRAHNDFGPFYASTPGFVAITLSPETMQAQVIDSKSTVLHEWQRAPALPAP